MVYESLPTLDFPYTIVMRGRNFETLDGLPNGWPVEARIAVEESICRDSDSLPVSFFQRQAESDGVASCQTDEYHIEDVRVLITFIHGS